MFLLFWTLVGLVGAGIVALVHRHRGQPVDAAELLLRWLLLAVVGLAGLGAFFAHTIYAADTAENIGFPAGNPFQYEVAVAHLAIAVLALVAVEAGGPWRVAAGMTAGLWLGGDSVVHTYELFANENTEPDNSGMFLVTEVVVALALLVLAAVEASRQRRRTGTPAARGEPGGS